MGLWLALVSAALVADATRVAPVEKVLTMLKDLTAKVEAEGEKEARAYDEYACFCKSTMKAKNRAIAEGTAKVATLQGDIASAQTERDTQTSDVKTLQGEIETLDGEIATADDERKTAKEHFEVADAEMTAAVKGIRRAIEQIKAGAKDKGHSENGVPVSDYGSHSEENTATLEALHNTFRIKREDKRQEETAAESQHAVAVQAKKDLIKQKETSIKAKNDMIASLSTELSKLQTSVTRANVELNDDKHYLKELQANCAAKKTEYDQRKTLRTGELAALTQANGVLASTVKEMGEATGEGGRALVHKASTEDSVAAAHKGAFKPPATLKNSKRSSQHKGAFKPPSSLKKEVRPVSFVQLAQPKRPDPMSEAVASLLTRTGSRIGSKELSALATTVESLSQWSGGGSAFDKVKGLIEGLITRLQEEAANDATHQGWCVEETHKAEKDRDYRLRELDREEAKTRKLQATRAALVSEKAYLEDEISDLDAQHTEMEEARSAEKAENAQTVSDAKAGAAALEDAKKILTDFYEASKTAEVPALVQDDPRLDARLEGRKTALERSEDTEPDTGFEGAYQGSQSAMTGIVGMLEVILGDFERMDKETSAAEAKAEREWTALSREMQLSLSKKRTALSSTESAIDDADGDLVDSKGQYQSLQGLLDGAVKSLDELHASCKAGGAGDGSDQSASTLSAGDREEKRAQEVAALKDALCILGECMPGVAEPVSAKVDTFLQRA